MTQAKNIALFETAASAVDDVKDRFALPKIADAARLGFAYAVAEGIRMSLDVALAGNREHNFAVASIDETGDFPTLLKIAYPEHDFEEVDAYRLTELLMNAGLIELEKRLKSGEIAGVSDLLADVGSRGGHSRVERP